MKLKYPLFYRFPGHGVEERDVFQPRSLPEDFHSAWEAQHLPRPPPPWAGEAVQDHRQHREPHLAGGGECPGPEQDLREQSKRLTMKPVGHVPLLAAPNSEIMVVLALEGHHVPFGLQLLGILIGLSEQDQGTMLFSHIQLHVQLASCMCRFCIQRSNQPQIENICGKNFRKVPESKT